MNFCLSECNRVKAGCVIFVFLSAIGLRQVMFICLVLYMYIYMYIQFSA